MSSRANLPINTILSHLFRLAKDDDVRSVVRKLLRLVNTSLVDYETIPELTYSEVIKYFVEQRPDDPRIVKGAVLLVPQQQGIRTHFLFLDENSDVLSGPDGKVYGKTSLVATFDDELKEAFGDTELLIFE